MANHGDGNGRRGGAVALVGAGPGDPALLTIRAAREMAAADVVLYDRLVSAEVLALANPNAEFIFTGKEEGQQEEMQELIYQLLLEHALAGRRVVRVKGGDPFVFGRGAEEALFLRRHGVPVEIVPGISSAIGVPAAAGIPVTCRGIAASFAVIAGRCAGEAAIDWSDYRAIGTLVILMGVVRRQEIAHALIAAGRSSEEPVAFIENGGREEERVVEANLGAVAAGAVDVASPAFWVVGEVVRLRSTITAARVLSGLVAGDE